MASQRMPALFLSHGSPLLAIVDSAARRFLSELGVRLPRPAAVVVLSAHHDAERVEITSGARPTTIHDFGGFPRELYELRYPAPGAPELAARIQALLSAADIDAALEASRGFDHGAWIPLLLMYPAADLPVVQVSIDSSRDAAWHFALGRALRPLREDGVLRSAPAALRTTSVCTCTRARGRRSAAAGVGRAVQRLGRGGDRSGALRRLAPLPRARPYVEENHPTHEHFLPLFAPLGAARDDERGERIHASYDRGLLSLDSYAFGGSLPSNR